MLSGHRLFIAEGTFGQDAVVTFWRRLTRDLRDQRRVVGDAVADG